MSVLRTKTVLFTCDFFESFISDNCGLTTRSLRNHTKTILIWNKNEELFVVETTLLRLFGSLV